MKCDGLLQRVEAGLRDLRVPTPMAPIILPFISIGKPPAAAVTPQDRTARPTPPFAPLTCWIADQDYGSSK